MITFLLIAGPCLIGLEIFHYWLIEGRDDLPITGITGALITIFAFIQLWNGQ